jgi:hypothetical protein
MKNLARWVRVGGPMLFLFYFIFPFLGWLAGWLGDAASLVLAPWPTHHPQEKRGKIKKEKKKSIP